MTDGAASTAAGGTAGCTNIWQHTITRASAGYCGREPADHKITVTCPSCRAAGDQDICDVCWPSVQVLNLCATCFTQTEITVREGS